MIGQRSHEILRLRTNAKNQYEPGFIEKKCLYLFRSSSSKGTYPYAEIRAELRQCLDAHQNWLRIRYPNGTPWYFPSPENARKPLGPSALTHGLARITKELGLPHRTSHGCGRAYFINCLRTDRKADGTHRYTDGEIALRVGQETQGKLISSVYGKIPPYQLTFVPESSPPAWARWLPAAGIGAAEQLTLKL
jgi:integrase